MNTKKRETIEFDVLFVGGGIASLSSAIKFAKLAQISKEKNFEIAVIEKGAEIGAHSLSGAVFDQKFLKELIPDFLEKGFPFEREIKNDALYFLKEKTQFKIPFTPPSMHNKGFYIISLSKVNKWFAKIAEEEFGINIFPGFTGKEMLYSEDNKSIIGVRTGDRGVKKDGSKKPNYEAGMDILAKVTVLGEGAKGNLMRDIDEKFNIHKMPPVFETGIKEVIKLPESNFLNEENLDDVHTLNYPLGFDVPGGGFIYRMKENKIALGFLTALSYADPYLDIYEEFIKFKKHPFIANIIKDGKVLEQGARCVPVGGYYSIPKLFVNGALFIGADASIHNTSAIKGLHSSMKSGMLAAEACFYAFEKNDFSEKSLSKYEELFETSTLKKEMFKDRNLTQTLSKKGFLKFINIGLQQITNGKGLSDNMLLEDDSKTLKPTKNFKERKPFDKTNFDEKLYLDKLTGVYLSKTMHDEDEPCHIIIKDKNICIECFEKYKAPCVRFCPGGVYEIEESSKKIKLNPSNCLHCKTCEIKDPYQNILWQVPEGGGGPNYINL